MPTPVGSQTFAFADGNAGHACDFGSSPTAGQWDVLCVNSDTTVSTPSGFTAAESAVTNQGAYVFVREAAGGESSSVTVTTNGDFNCTVVWTRWDSSLVAVDTSTNTQANASNGSTTPTHTTGTLAETGELSIAFAALHAIGSANQAETWSSGYTQIAEVAQSTGARATRAHVAYKENAGTAAEAPQMTWTGDVVADRYMLAVTFTVASTGVTGDGAGTFPLLTGAGTAEESMEGTGAGSFPLVTGAGTADESMEGDGAGTFPQLTGAGTGTSRQDITGNGAGSFPALTGAGTGTGGVVDTGPATTSGGWYGLLSIIREGRQMVEEDRRATPVACPNDGEPLLEGPDGVLFCRFDGWRYTA